MAIILSSIAIIGLGIATAFYLRKKHKKKDKHK
jgi:prolipoprotein diacylglyceryltransferase